MIRFIFNRRDRLSGLAVFGCLGLLGASDLYSVSSAAVSAAYAKSNEAEEQENESVVQNSCGTSPSDFGGLYFGLGASWQNFKRKVTVSDNEGSYEGIDEDIEGVGYGDKKDVLLLDRGKGALGGTVFAGYGWQLSKCLYVSVEALLDFARKCKSTQEVVLCYTDVGEEGGVGKDVWESKVKTNALVPTFSVRVGGIVSCLDCLLYLKGGLSYLRNEFSTNQLIVNEDCDVKVFKSSRVVPVVGVGVEKRVFKAPKKSFALRIEWEHRFDAKKVWKYEYYNGNGYNAWPVCRMRGDVVRVLLCIN